MPTVNVAELKNSLSRYLRVVRAGGELIIKDRDRPIARIVPFDPAPDECEARLIAEGRMKPAFKPMDWDRFDAIGRGIKLPDLTGALHRAMSEEGEDGHVGFLGLERRAAALRSESGESAGERTPAKGRSNRVVVRSRRSPKRA